tara:strand:+ start:393 stop:1283 length:891 start_codon:yes stop_codon:yes gene_type:complete
MKKKVLITGSSGFIGSSLVGELIKLNYEIYCIDKIKKKQNKNKNIKILNLDITNLKLNKIPTNFTYIFHLAAELGVAHTINNSDTLLINNLITTRKIIEIAKSQKSLKRIFFASTSEIYDHSQSFKEDEKIMAAPLSHPRSSYWISKYAGEFLVINSNLPYTVLRIFNAYGKNMKKNLFFDIQKKLKRKVAIFENPNHVRSFIHIDNLVQMILITRKQIFKNKILNLGNPNQPIKIKDLINLCCKKLNFKGKLIFQEVKNNSPKSRKPSIARINKLSKKKIIFKSLQQGINEILTD